MVGWVSIDGTNINYPVMQTRDNPNYYLKHSFEKAYSDYGVPYVQEDCDIDLSDNTVIYGHHMKNGTMFSDLCKYTGKDFYAAHKTVRFDTLGGYGKYEIIAVFKTAAYSEQGFKYYHFVNAHEESDDGHGNIVETETTVTHTYLYITVSHKTADEMADKCGFNADQRKQLSELLADENNSMWSAVLYGIGTGDGEIVTVALSQVGNVGGQPYWSWYGFDSRVEWCACFVSWCADQCGYIDAGVIPKYAGYVWGVQWFEERGQWQDNSYEPRPGDIIFFDWDDENGQDGESDHTGIVERVENGRVYTVEGNSGDSCRQNSYPIGYYEVLGYGCPAY